MPQHKQHAYAGAWGWVALDCTRKKWTESGLPSHGQHAGLPTMVGQIKVALDIEERVGLAHLGGDT